MSKHYTLRPYKGRLIYEVLSKDNKAIGFIFWEDPRIDPDTQLSLSGEYFSLNRRSVELASPIKFTDFTTVQVLPLITFR